jgi:hypothetical protein
MAGELTADEICGLLELERHVTCGFVRLTFTSKQMIAPGGLAAPFADARPLGSALYFMATRAAPVRLHRIRNDQLYQQIDVRIGVRKLRRNHYDLAITGFENAGAWHRTALPNLSVVEAAPERFPSRPPCP